MSRSWWRVEVSDHEGQIVAIESEMLAGRDIGEREAETIRNCAAHLLGFVGEPRAPGSTSPAASPATERVDAVAATFNPAITAEQYFKMWARSCAVEKAQTRRLEAIIEAGLVDDDTLDDKPPRAPQPTARSEDTRGANPATGMLPCPFCAYHVASMTQERVSSSVTAFWIECDHCKARTDDYKCGPDGWSDNIWHLLKNRWNERRKTFGFASSPAPSETPQETKP